MKNRSSESIAENLKQIWHEKVMPPVRDRLFVEEVIDGPFGKFSFGFLKNFFKLGRIPYLRDRIPEFHPEKSNLSWIPINREIEGGGQVALSEAVLDRLIEKARHRVIVNFCGCRKVADCDDYPHDIGCLMMGESALQIPEKSRREVGIDEAKAHIRRAFEAGLIPVTGKARIDNDLFMIRDEGKLLTVCLCCECCCITRFTRAMTPEILDGMHHPVEGLSIEVTDDCVACGECVSKCYIDAIRVKGDRAVVGEMCRICGRCAMHCPQNAIKLKLDNPDAVDDVVRRIEGVVDF